MANNEKAEKAAIYLYCMALYSTKEERKAKTILFFSLVERRKPIQLRYGQALVFARRKGSLNDRHNTHGHRNLDLYRTTQRLNVFLHTGMFQHQINSYVLQLCRVYCVL